MLITSSASLLCSAASSKARSSAAHVRLADRPSDSSSCAASCSSVSSPASSCVATRRRVASACSSPDVGRSAAAASSAASTHRSGSLRSTPVGTPDGKNRGTSQSYMEGKAMTWQLPSAAHPQLYCRKAGKAPSGCRPDEPDLARQEGLARVVGPTVVVELDLV